jgi:hypothetical protein
MMIGTAGVAPFAHLGFARKEQFYILLLSELAIFIEGLILFATKQDE